MKRFTKTFMFAIRLVIGLLLGLTMAPSGLHADELFLSPSVSPISTPSPANTRIYGRLYSRDILRGVTLKSVYKYNDLWTTALGPAYANITEQASNFLKCSPPTGRSFSYALCYYSGPVQPTGSNPQNPSLPCTLSKDGLVANCTCYAINNTGSGAKTPYLVDINAISNLDIYQETISACGNDGSNCPTTSPAAPVCEAINTNLLVPGADLVSVFSTLYMGDYSSSSSDTTSCNGVYAGCMTAPCQRTGQFDAAGNELVNCACPIFNGPYQIGQANQSCDANVRQDGTAPRVGPQHVWSAAYNSSNQALPLTDSQCTPDMAGKNGCPLYSTNKIGGTQMLDPNSQLCKNVCASYETSTPVTPGLQVGFTCDATLCTTIGIGQGKNYNPSVAAQTTLASQACQGVGQMANFTQIALAESLSNCSCCASQICGCAIPNEQTNQSISRLNKLQRINTIEPQCGINGTLCGKP
ncbi:MAG: hypothetical protein RLZ25_1365 [Pseudomonadota bacterium]